MMWREVKWGFLGGFGWGCEERAGGKGLWVFLGFLGFCSDLFIIFFFSIFSFL